MGAYAEGARRRVHIVTVLLRPPSGDRSGRRQARHVHILQIGLRLAIVQADASPDMHDVKYEVAQVRPLHSLRHIFNI